METKKNPKVDLEKKRTLFVEIGFLVALSVVLFAFEVKQYEKEMMVMTNAMAKTDLEETVIKTERQQQNTPPPPRAVVTTLEIVDNNEEILDEIDIDIEADEETELQSYTPVKSTEEDVQEEEIFVVVEKQAAFPGGQEALFKWLSENLKYPEQAKDAGIEGVVYVQFVVEKNGSITDVEIRQSSLGGGCEEAAMAAVSKMPSWEAAKQRNKPVRSLFILPVQFQLSK